MNDGLKDKYRLEIKKILCANPRVKRIVLFGSRAMGMHSTTSDVDIALFGEELTLDDLSKLASEIEDLDVPQRVDLLIRHRIESEELLEHIKRHGVEWSCER